MAQEQGHNAYMPGYAKLQVQHHEWRTAENSAAYLIPTLKETAQSNPHLKLLDVGAGSGTISASLAKYMPQGQVTATDISDDILASAASHAQDKGVTNISFGKADIYALPFPDASFDIVHASMVLSHLDAPAQAYQEMLRVTKPGGVVANRESDLRMCSYYPETAAMVKFHQLLLKTMDAAGGQNSAGPRLVHWALEAGAKREQITPSFGTWTYSSPEERQMWGKCRFFWSIAVVMRRRRADVSIGSTMVERLRKGGIRDKALQLGIATEADLDEMINAWEAWVAAEDGLYGSMHGEVLIRK